MTPTSPVGAVGPLLMVGAALRGRPHPTHRCRCGRDCKAEQRAAMGALDVAAWRPVWAGRMEATCDLCGFTSPAGGFCNGAPGKPCGHYPPVASWHRRIITEAQRRARTRPRPSLRTPRDRAGDSEAAA